MKGKLWKFQWSVSSEGLQFDFEKEFVLDVDPQVGDWVNLLEKEDSFWYEKVDSRELDLLTMKWSLQIEQVHKRVNDQQLRELAELAKSAGWTVEQTYPIPEKAPVAKTGAGREIK